MIRRPFKQTKLGRIHLTAVLVLLPACISFAVSDSAIGLFRQGVANYDSVTLKSAFTLAGSEHPDSDFLFKATCLWRIQVIKYSVEDKKGLSLYGTRALELLDSAEKNHEDSYFVNARRAYASQLLAGTGIKNGATYGPRTAKHLSAMKKLRPGGFETRFIEAVNLLEMPSFVGGNSKKALELLRGLFGDFPDSADVAKSLAMALAKGKQKEEALELLDRVLLANPKDLWAAKVKKNIH